MKNIQFEDLCRAVESGEEHFVENILNHHAGRLVACRGEEVDVDILGKRETWSARDCQEFNKPDFDYHR
jgi:hypothetical protein